MKERPKNVPAPPHKMKLRTITFTGVDEWTDVDQLEKLYRKYPMIEFGVLLSTDHKENGNRFPDPAILERFEGRRIPLSAHLCGDLARKAIKNNFDPARNVCGGRFNLFTRCQLNVSTFSKIPKEFVLDIPEEVEEVIIQQSSDSMEFLDSTEPNSRLTLLFDNSGGRGLYTPFNPVPTDLKVGYAGGLNIDNIEHTIFLIEMDEDSGPYWLDMESSVRTDDKFDLDKVKAIMEKVFWT